MVEVTKLNLGQDSEARFGQGARGQRPFGTFSENSSVLLPSFVLKTSGLELSSLWLADEMFDSSFLGVLLVIASLCTKHYVPGPVPRPVSS